MASYHLSAKIVSRSGARSSVAAAAYRSRSEIEDKRQGITFDYTKKSDLVHSEIMLPEGAPKRLEDRSVLWNEVEAKEIRKDAQLAREIEIALPRELNLDEQKELVREYAQEQFVNQGMIADINIHHHKDNPHAHIMLTTRRVSKNGFEEKVRDWNKKEQVIKWREQWAVKQNEKLLATGHDTRVDHRSYQDRGIDLIPQKHLGYNLKFVPKEYLNLEEIKLDNVEEYILTKQLNGEKIINNPDKALSFLTHYNVTFTNKDIDTFLATHTAGITQFNEAKDKLTDSPEMIPLGINEKGEQLYTTKTMIEKEKLMFDRAEYLDLEMNHPVSPEILQQTLANYTLTDEQEAAFQYVVNGGDISMVMGRAGSGKSYTLSAVREAYEAEGYRVRGIALSGIAAENLEQSSGIPSTTIYAQLQKWEQGKDLLTDKDIVVVDEAGFVGTRQMHDIVNQVHEAGGKAIMTGDIEQLPSIEAGGAARGIMERTGYAEISKIMRQHEEWQREATTLMSSPEDHMKEAIEKYADHGRIFEAKDTDQAIDRLVNDWKEYTRQNPDKSALITTYSNKEVSYLNGRAREEARLDGRVAEQGHFIRTEKGAVVLAEGDRIIFLENNKALDVKNGSLGTVLAVEDTATHKANLLVKLDNEKMVSFSTGQYQNVDYGYAMTVHKSQGSTVDRSFVLATKRFDKHVTYVSMSRHRDNVTLYYGKNDFKDREAFIKAAETRNEKSLVQDFAKNRGYETLEPEFRKTMLYNREYLEVPKGRLQEPIKGEYHGDVAHEGKNYHQIYDIHNNRNYLVPATEKGVDQNLRLRDVEYDGKSVKAPEKGERVTLGVFRKAVHARVDDIDKQLQKETNKDKRRELVKERQGLSRLTTSMSNIKTKDLEKTITVAKAKTPQDLQRQIPAIEQQIKQIKTLEKDLGRGR